MAKARKHVAQATKSTPKLQRGQWIWLKHDERRFLCYVSDVGERQAYLLMDDLTTGVAFIIGELASSNAAYGKWNRSGQASYPNCLYGPYVPATNAEVRAYNDGQQQALRRMRWDTESFDARRADLQSLAVR